MCVHVCTKPRKRSIGTQVEYLKMRACVPGAPQVALPMLNMPQKHVQRAAKASNGNSLPIFRYLGAIQNLLHV